MVYAMCAIAGLGWIVWGHHMFQSGMNPYLGTTFMISTMVIAVPSAIKTFNWLGTLWRGQLHFTTPMLNAIAFVAMFAIGGLSGIFMASTPVDIFIHDTYFIVGHIHYVLFGGSLFGAFAGLYFWFPKMFGRMMNETWGKVHFWLTFIFFNGVMFPMHILGMRGMQRRIYDYTQYTHLKGLQPMNIFMSVSAFALGVSQLILIVNFFWSLRKGRAGRRQSVEVEHAGMADELASAAREFSPRFRSCTTGRTNTASRAWRRTTCRRRSRRRPPCRLTDGFSGEDALRGDVPAAHRGRARHVDGVRPFGSRLADDVRAEHVHVSAVALGRGNPVRAFPPADRCDGRIPHGLASRSGFWLRGAPAMDESSRRESRFFAVCLQGILGGLTVKYLLPTPISVAHACLAQTFFCLTLALAIFTSRSWNEVTNLTPRPPLQMERGWPEAGGEVGPGMKGWVLACFAVLYVQLVLGAWMRHSAAGLAIPDFPASFGGIVPDHWNSKIAIHFAHRAWALVVAATVFTTVSVVLRANVSTGVRRAARLLAVLLPVQMLLGALRSGRGRRFRRPWRTRRSERLLLACAAGLAIFVFRDALLERLSRGAFAVAARGGRRAMSSIRPLAGDAPVASSRGKWSDFVSLAKPRVNTLVLVTTGWDTSWRNAPRSPRSFSGRSSAPVSSRAEPRRSTRSGSVSSTPACGARRIALSRPADSTWFRP